MTLGARPELETEMRIQKERAKRRALPSWLRVRVGDVPVKPPVLLQPATLIVQALRRLRETSSSAVLVVNAEDRLLGIVTLADLALEKPDQPIANAMSPAEVVDPDDLLSDALRWMLVRDFSQVPVVDAEGTVHGLVRIEDALREITAPYARHIATRPADPSRGYSPRYGG